ncbi:MAG: aspartate kinase [Firmicutes bacterium]|nr:aspartate kinase [Bacillota bacterium]
MAIIVQKFGGSSVANAERIQRVARRAAEAAAGGNQVAVVVSAMGDTTDDLIDLASQLNPTPPSREMDMLLSTGEQQSIALLAMALHAMGKKAISLTGAQAGYQTDGVYSRAKILKIDSQRVLDELNKGNIVIVAGFQGVGENGEITTLGRGGSDTSAVALAIALNADLCEIYTDVDGVYTADPRIIKTAWKIPEISYDEMLEMAVLGALVLQPRSVELAKQHNIPLHVRSSFNHSQGTIVKEVAPMQKDLEKELIVCGVAHDLHVLKTTIFGIPDRPGVSALIFGLLAAEGVNVDMIIQSGTREDKQDISFTCGRDEKDKVAKIAAQVVKELDAQSYLLEDNIAKISVVGAGMMTHPGVAAIMFKTLADIDCNILMIATSEIKISCIIDETKINEAAIALHKAFHLDR